MLEKTGPATPYHIDPKCYQLKTKYASTNTEKLKADTVDIQIFNHKFLDRTTARIDEGDTALQLPASPAAGQI